jgi:hypothetical protein
MRAGQSGTLNVLAESIRRFAPNRCHNPSLQNIYIFGSDFYSILICPWIKLFECTTHRVRAD